MTEYIEFKKKRELGDVLTDTFAFLRSQFKPFFTTFLKIVGPYLLTMLICFSLYMYYAGNVFTSILTNGVGSSFDSASFGTIFAVSILYFVSLIFVYVLSQSTTLHYIKSYNEGNGLINFEEIKSNVYNKFGSFLGLGFLVSISVIIGFIFCFIPGIYLFVPLSLTFSLLVFADKDVSDCYSDSFKLIKNEWWITFATILVVGIIVGIANYAFAIPAQIYQFARIGLVSGEADAETLITIFQDPIYLILNMISVVAQFLLNVISVIAAAFIYFNLNEKKNFTGTFERIKNLGETAEN